MMSNLNVSLADLVSVVARFKPEKCCYVISWEGLHHSTGRFECLGTDLDQIKAHSNEVGLSAQIFATFGGAPVVFRKCSLSPTFRVFGSQDIVTQILKELYEQGAF